MSDIGMFDSMRPTRPFAWSYSRLNNWRSCARKHAVVDLLKRVPPDSHPAMNEGQRVHDAIAKYIKSGVPLPTGMEHYREEVDRVVGNPQPLGVKTMVEENMSIRRDFVPCGSFEPGVWLRVKVDFAKIGQQAAVAVDWKTGKIKPDIEQLALMAQCIFSLNPYVQKIRTQYVWLGMKATTTEDFERSKMPALWRGLMPEIDSYERAYNSGIFPPNPSGLCKRHCQVAACEFHGKGRQW